MFDYTDVRPKLDDIRNDIQKLQDKIHHIYNDVFTEDGTSIMVDAVIANMTCAIDDLDKADSVLAVVEDRYEDYLKE